MTLQELKNQIESCKVTDDLIIFKNSESDFISNQYIRAISRIKKLEINYINDLEPLLHPSVSLFEDSSAENSTNLTVLRSDTYKWYTPSVRQLKNVIIVVNKFEDKEQEKLLNPFIVPVPKLEDWQFKDYVYSIAEGVPTKELDWLINICGKNRDRLEQTLNKLSIFQSVERRYVFDELVHDGEFDDLTQFGIFNYTGAIIAKDYNTLFKIYQEIDSVDINEFGLLKILLQNFKNLLMVQLNSNPTPENTGLESKQLWAVKKQPKMYSPEQLVQVFQFLSDIDRQVKNGELPTEIMRDYILIKILSIGG